MGPPYVGMCDQTYVLKGADLLTVEDLLHIVDTVIKEEQLYFSHRNMQHATDPGHKG